MTSTIEDKIKAQLQILSENFEERAKQRIISQYQNSPKFLGEAGAYAAEIDRLKDAVTEILVYRSLDKAQGVNLDVLGEIVGQPRVSIPDASIRFFGFARRPPLPQSNNLGFGDGRFRLRSDNDEYIQFPDNEYRVIITARIFANYFRSTAPDQEEFFYLVFGLRVFIQNFSAEGRVYFLGGKPTETQRVLITYQWTDAYDQRRDFLPYTLGVHREIRETSTDYFFGYSAEPMARGYGVGGYASDSAFT